MNNERTSQEIAELASGMMRMDADRLAADIGNAIASGPDGLNAFLMCFTADIRSLAASCLTQTPDR